MGQDDSRDENQCNATNGKLCKATVGSSTPGGFPVNVTTS